MLTFRPADPEMDRDLLLELHCLGNFNGDQPWFRGDSYEVYRQTWLATPQPAGFLSGLESRLDDGSAVAEVCEEAGRAVGYFCLGFYEVEGYDLRVAEIEDISVLPSEQRRGIGTIMLQRAEELARARGATLMRAEIGSANLASRALHENAGFEPSRLIYEKRLLRDA